MITGLTGRIQAQEPLSPGMSVESENAGEQSETQTEQSETHSEQSEAIVSDCSPSFSEMSSSESNSQVHLSLSHRDAKSKSMVFTA